MRPRGFLGTFLRLAIFTGTTFGVLFSFAMALVRHGYFADVFWPAGAMLGVVFGVFTACIGTPASRAISKRVATVPEGGFVPAVTLALAEWDYHPQLITPTVLTFAKPGFPGWGGKVTIVFGKTDATVVGPARLVRTLLTRLGVPDTVSG